MPGVGIQHPQVAFHIPATWQVPGATGGLTSHLGTTLYASWGSPVQTAATAAVRVSFGAAFTELSNKHIPFPQIDHTTWVVGGTHQKGLVWVSSSLLFHRRSSVSRWSHSSHSCCDHTAYSHNTAYVCVWPNPAMHLAKSMNAFGSTLGKSNKNLAHRHI